MPQDDIERRLIRALHAYLDDAHPAGGPVVGRARRRTAGAPVGLLAVAAVVVVVAALTVPALTGPGGPFAPAAATSPGQAAGLSASGGIADGLSADVGGASPVASTGVATGQSLAASSGAVPVLPSPVAPRATSRITSGGSAAHGTATPVATAAPRPSPTPAPTASAAGTTVVVTIAEAGATVHVAVGDRLQLELGTLYTWAVSLAPAGSSVLVAVPGALPAGQQGAWTATKAGSVTVVAVGDPLCRQAKPACMLASREFTLTVVAG